MKGKAIVHRERAPQTLGVRVPALEENIEIVLKGNKNSKFRNQECGQDAERATKGLTLKSGASQTTFHQPSVILPFEDETEAIYFGIFREEISVELSGVFMSTFWNHLLLQESHHQPFVRHALVAIAALNKSIKTSQLVRNNIDVKKTARKQREYALSLYGKSLQGMQFIPQGQVLHLRELVIAVLLVFVFETIHRQPDVAFSHALIGDRLMCHFVEMTPYSIPHNEGISSPAANVIEHELLMTFIRFDVQMMTFIDARSNYIHNKGKATCVSTMREMPSAFASLREATVYWEAVMRRSGHFILSTSAVNRSSMFQREFSDPFSDKTMEINTRTSIYGSPYVVPESLLLEQLEYSSDIEAWSTAFAPLQSRLERESTDIQTATALMILRLYSLTLRIVVEGTIFTEECKYDKFLLDFRKMISLARTISTNLLNITNQQPAYHFHLSVVPPLFTLLLRCRDGTLRREAISILRRTQYDGPWDRYMIAAVGKWIMELEEVGEENGYIPEYARVRLSRLSMSMETRNVVVQCVRRDKTSPGLDSEGVGFVWMETRLKGPWI
ncbi:hypothetical protein EG329_007888 [Mollisiaceae sp. DMI_Dod_QoI]|nr:hypothetical protein EG329_007888 [Helotiales sp. DMI_Dod_QoI]